MVAGSTRWPLARMTASTASTNGADAARVSGMEEADGGAAKRAASY